MKSGALLHRRLSIRPIYFDVDVCTGSFADSQPAMQPAR